MVVNYDPWLKDWNFVFIIISYFFSSKLIINTFKNKFRLYRSHESFSTKGTNQKKATLDKSVSKNLAWINPLKY